jgi:protein involved in polysaccharide export with SLBB domain
MCGEDAGANDWRATSVADGGLGVPSRSYSLTSLTQGGVASNPEIFSGDVILVHKAHPVYVTGEVIRPGELNIPEGGLPLTQAIAMASGITREAKTKNIKIYRRKNNAPQPEVIAVNYDQIKKGLQKDMILEPFDIVEVDKSKKSIGDILLEAVTGIPNRLPIPIRPF